MSSNSKLYHRVFQKLHSVLLSSSDTVCILSLLLLLFLARYFDVVYLLDSHLLVCKLIKFDASHKPPGHLSQLCCFGHFDSVLLTQVEWNVNAVFGLCWQEILFACIFRKQRRRDLGLRLPPKYNTYTARSLPNKSSVLLGD